jgi:hypothetical protein
MAFIVVLNDGETFTSLDGCRIVEIDDTYLENFDEESEGYQGINEAIKFYAKSLYELVEDPSLEKGFALRARDPKQRNEE